MLPMSFTLHRSIEVTLTHPLLPARPPLPFSPVLPPGPESFPVRVGSHRTLTRPSLEFIKAVGHVLSLDQTVLHQVRLTYPADNEGVFVLDLSLTWHTRRPSSVPCAPSLCRWR